MPDGLSTEAAIAHVIVSKLGDHTPFYRQAEIYARQGILIGRRWATGQAERDHLNPLASISNSSPSGSHAPPSGHGRSSVHGRNHGAGARSRAWPNEGRRATSGRSSPTTAAAAAQVRRSCWSDMRPAAAAPSPSSSWTALTDASCNATVMTGCPKSLLRKGGHRRPADRTALRPSTHRCHGARLITGHPAGHPQGAFAAHRRGVEAVVPETAVDDLQQLDARRGHPLRAQSLAGADPLPPRRASRCSTPIRSRTPSGRLTFWAKALGISGPQWIVLMALADLARRGRLDECRR